VPVPLNSSFSTSCRLAQRELACCATNVFFDWDRSNLSQQALIAHRKLKSPRQRNQPAVQGVDLMPAIFPRFLAGRSGSA
jgi:hypothetical protein